VRENYNSLAYWENVINKNKTIRGHMFMKNPPTDKSYYFHTLIFCNKCGISNIWGYVPSMRSLIGYIKYSFLQEAFYKWIYGRERAITRIPHFTVDKIIKDGKKGKKISEDIAFKMIMEYESLDKLWGISDCKIDLELRKFAISFSRRWTGDNSGFMYMKVFKTPEELGECVISSIMITHTENEIEDILGMKIDGWRNICKEAIVCSDKGEIFREVLLKNLKEVF
jgi:hypothetical protein